MKQVKRYLKGLLDKKNASIFLLCSFVIALSLRLIIATTLPQDFLSESMAKVDRIQYHTLAVNLLNSGIYGFVPGEPDSSLPPGYPVFLTLTYLFLGTNLLSIRLVQGFVSALTVILFFYLACRTYPNRYQVVIVSTLLVTIYPVFIIYGNFQLTETLYVFMTLLLLLVAQRSLESLNVSWGLLTGFLLGVTLLVREVLVLFVIVLACIALTRQYPWRRCLLYLLALSIGMSLPLGLWTARSIIHTGHPIFITDRASAAASSVAGVELPPDYQNLNDEIRERNTFDAMRYATFKQMLDIQFFLSDPVAYLWLIAARFELTWLHPNGLEALPLTLLQHGYRLLHILTVLLALVSIYEMLQQPRWQLGLLAGLWGYSIIVHLFLSTAAPRYSIPVLPIILLFATNGICWIYQKLSSRSIAN